MFGPSQAISSLLGGGSDVPPTKRDMRAASEAKAGAWQRVSSAPPVSEMKPTQKQPTGLGGGYIGDYISDYDTNNDDRVSMGEWASGMAGGAYDGVKTAGDDLSAGVGKTAGRVLGGATSGVVDALGGPMIVVPVLGVVLYMMLNPKRR